MKNYSFETGGLNDLFTWGYVTYEGKRSIWVHSLFSFGITGDAVIDDFGDLVHV